MTGHITDFTAAGTLTGAELLEVSQLSTTVRKVATTLSAQASDNSYNDSGAGFITAGFAVGDRVNVAGFTGNAANNITVGVITALTAGKMTIGGSDGDVIVDDAAGESVTIAKWTTRRTTAAALAASGGGLPAASAAEVRAGTSTTKAATPSALAGSAAVQTLTDGATINWDMSAGYNAKVTLGGNRTLATPTNPIEGLSYTLAVIQDGTGSRTMTWPSGFDWGTTGAPTLTTTASKVDQITLQCTDASTPKFRAYLSGKGFAS